SLCQVKKWILGFPGPCAAGGRGGHVAPSAHHLGPFPAGTVTTLRRRNPSPEGGSRLRSLPPLAPLLPVLVLLGGSPAFLWLLGDLHPNVSPRFPWRPGPRRGCLFRHGGILLRSQERQGLERLGSAPLRERRPHRLLDEPGPLGVRLEREFG